MTAAVLDGKAGSVVAVREVEVRYKPLRRRLPVTGDVNTSAGAAQVASAVLANVTVEQFIALHVDAKHALIGIHIGSIGALDSTLVHPRDVFKAAVLTNAAGIIVAHNHPSGDPAPSPDDREIMARLWRAGTIVGVELLDAIIVADPRDVGGVAPYDSFREAGALPLGFPS